MWAWREHVRRSGVERTLDALQRELEAADALQASLALAVTAVKKKADETERVLGPALARHVRDQADVLAERRERTAARMKLIREQIGWQRKELKG